MDGRVDCQYFVCGLFRNQNRWGETWHIVHLHFAGLSSSTALTLQFSHLSREQANISPLLASGILLSCGTMFPRLLIILFVINPQLVSLLWPIVMAMMAALYLPAWWIWRRSEVEQIEQSNKQSNPLALQSALFLG